MTLMDRVFPAVVAEAHCDIPCGVYDPTPAKIAAKTVARMVQQITELEVSKEADKHAMDAYLNAIARRISIKEQHAETCKRELEILWSDYFKPEHLKEFPDLHDNFWSAVKLCSKNKQEIDADLTHQLVAAVDEIAEIFYKTKKAPERFDSYKTITDSLY